MTDFASRARAIIADKLGIPEDQITPNGKFVEDLGADSLDSVELVMALEEEFGIEIPDEAAEKIHCFSDVMEFVKSRQAVQ